MRIPEISWESQKSHGNPRNPMEIPEIP